MNLPTTTIEPRNGDLTTEQIVHLLRQPPDMNRVKRRQSPGLGSVPYLEGYDVIEVANDLFQFRWSFDLLSEPRIMHWDKVITAYDPHLKKKAPVLGEDGKPLTEVAGMVYITGRISVQLAGKSYSHADAGRCIFSGDSPEALDMALAGAVTDCLKRCFRQMGEQFGNSLYDKDIARTAGLETTGTNGHGSNGNNGHQEKAVTPTPPAPSSNGMSYQDGVAVDLNNGAEVEAFNTFKTANGGQMPASRESLRAWKSNHNGKK